MLWSSCDTGDNAVEPEDAAVDEDVEAVVAVLLLVVDVLVVVMAAREGGGGRLIVGGGAIEDSDAGILATVTTMFVKTFGQTRLMEQQHIPSVPLFLLSFLVCVLGSSGPWSTRRQHSSG